MLINPLGVSVQFAVPDSTCWTALKLKIPKNQSISEMHIDGHKLQERNKSIVHLIERQLNSLKLCAECAYRQPSMNHKEKDWLEAKDTM